MRHSRRGAATSARCGLPQVGRKDVDLPPPHAITRHMRCSGRRTGKETWGEGAHEGGWRTRVASRRQPGTFKFRLGGSNGVLKAFDLANQMECWHAGVPDLAPTWTPSKALRRPEKLRGDLERSGPQRRAHRCPRMICFNKTSHSKLVHLETGIQNSDYS